MTKGDTNATGVPEGTVEAAQKAGVCLIEIWRQSRPQAPNNFWREMQSDGHWSLWRYMEPAFAKKALKAKVFTLDKDGSSVVYAARKFDARTATIDDYIRLRKLRDAFALCSDPALVCRACQDTKEIQATRPVVDIVDGKPSGRVQRFVVGCPECAELPQI